MKKRRSAEQIVGLLRQADVDLGKGMNVPDVCRRLGISQQTYYRWRTKFGGMDPKMAKQLQELQKENSRLRKLVADQALDMLILKEAARPNRTRPIHPATGSRRNVTTGDGACRALGKAGSCSWRISGSWSAPRRGARPRKTWRVSWRLCLGFQPGLLRSAGGRANRRGGDGGGVFGIRWSAAWAHVSLIRREVLLGVPLTGLSSTDSTNRIVRARVIGW
jgi:putative transposase